MKLQNVSLLSRPDTITWKLTASGQYTAKSAYQVQFLTRIPQPHLQQVWKITAEKKVKFFIWTLLQNRLWSGDRLQARNWDHNDLCAGCDQVLESAHHLILDCPFAKEIWFKTNSFFPLASQAARHASSISAWWNRVAKLKKKGRQLDECTAAVYIAWNIWLERNRRIFKDSAQPSTDVLVRARDDISLLSEAWEE